MAINTVYASAARTATPTAVAINTRRAKALVVVFDVTAVTSTPSTIVTVDGFDSVSGAYFNLLTGAAVATAVRTVYRIAPGLVVAANLTANDYLPDQVRITATHGNANSMTYSISAHLLD